MRLLVANHTSGVVGGAEQYLSDLIPRLRERGVDVRMLTEERGLPESPTNIWRVGGADRAAVLEEVTRWAPDVILVNGLSDPRLEQFFVTAFPAVLLAHNYYGTCISGEKRHKFPSIRCCERRFGKACLALYFPRGCGGMSVTRMFASYALQSARHALLRHYRVICTMSNHMAEEYQRNTETLVMRLPLWMPRQTSQAATRRMRDCFVYVGRMTELKGVEVLLEAAAWLRRERRLELKLVLIGDGPLRPRLERRAEQVSLQVAFRGWLDPAQRDEVVQTAAAVVIPSLWPEPLGLVALEAAGLGVPTVAFAVGGLVECVSNGRTGALASLAGDRVANLAEAIEKAVRDVDLGGAWGANAYQATRESPVGEHIDALLTALNLAAKTRP